MLGGETRVAECCIEFRVPHHDPRTVAIAPLNRPTVTELTKVTVRVIDRMGVKQVDLYHNVHLKRDGAIRMPPSIRISEPFNMVFEMMWAHRWAYSGP